MKANKAKLIRLAKNLRTVPITTWGVFAILLALIYTINTPRVLEPILNFLLAGVVPGTDIVLSPDVVLMGVVVSMFILFGSIFASAIIRTIEVRRAMKANAEDNAPATVSAAEKVGTGAMAVAAVAAADADAPVDFQEAETVQVPKEEVVYDTAAAEEAVETPAPANRLAWLGRMYDGAIRTLLKTEARLYALFRALSRSLGKWTEQSKPVIARFSKQVHHAAAVALKLLHRAGVWLAHKLAALHPYAIKFDGWLEKQYRASTAWTGRQFMRIELVQVLAQVVRESKDGFRQLFK